MTNVTVKHCSKCGKLLASPLAYPSHRSVWMLSLGQTCANSNCFSLCSLSYLGYETYLLPCTVRINIVGVVSISFHHFCSRFCMHFCTWCNDDV